MNPTQNRNYKVTVIGDTGTGKTSLINRFVYNRYDSFVSPTIGVENVHTDVKLSTCSASIRIWDTAGQEQFSSLVPMFSRDSDVCIVVADITKTETINNIDKWIEKLRKAGENPPIVVAINKTDLKTPKPLELIRSELQVKYPSLLFVSAMNGSYVKELFHMATRAAIENAAQTEEEAQADLMAGSAKKKSVCC